MVFRILLRYIYGEDVSSSLLEGTLERSHQRCCHVWHIKAQSGGRGSVVKFTPITIGNLVDNYYFSDTKKCALLKEKVLEFLMENGQEVLNKKVSLKDAPESSNMYVSRLSHCNDNGEEREQRL